LQKIIRPAAVRARINKRIGWHTFRHTFSTLLIANGENVKVAQELMRHASSRCALEVYSQARIIAKRQAQQRVVQMSNGVTSELPVNRPEQWICWQKTVRHITNASKGHHRRLRSKR
jgi:hypothetical protein